MESIDYEKVVSDCLEAVREELGRSWKKFKPFAEHELRQFAENAEFLAKLRHDQVIDDDELKARLEIQRLAFKNVVLTIKGVGLVTAQNAVNAILGIVRKAVRKALDVVLPIS
jgi:hypothetical protein